MKNYTDKEMPFFGVNASDSPLGDEEFFRDIQSVENLDGTHDELVEINSAVLTRPINVERGWIQDERMYLRKPAFEHLKDYDDALKTKFGWRVRVTDPYRPWTIQKEGFCWGVQEVIKNKGENWENFVAMVQRCLTGEGTSDEIEKIVQSFKDGDEFFSYVKPLPYDKEKFSHDLPDILIDGAANFGWVDLPLDKYALTPHSTGGVADIEWIDEKTGKLVNMGVPVDTQGLPSAFPYFEPRTAPILAAKVGGTPLESMEGRKKHYKEIVQKDGAVQAYLRETGVNVESALESESAFNDLWNAICSNRRAVANVAAELGIVFFGLESWHADFNNQRGGVAMQDQVNGGPGYAIHIGKKTCVWGNATSLWEKLTGIVN